MSIIGINQTKQTFSVTSYGKNTVGIKSDSQKKSTSLYKDGSRNIAMRVEMTNKNEKSAVSVLLSSSGTSSTSKKELDYNYKQMSKAISRTKTSQSATAIAAQIRAKITHLYSLLKSGEYDAEEVMAAIAHAEMMEQAALKRAQNLEIEEKAERAMKREEMEEMLEETGSAKSGEASGSEVEIDVLKEIKKQEKQSKEISEELKQLEQELEQAMDEFNEISSLYESMDDMNKVLSGEMTPEELKTMKKRHRAQENALMELADTTYLKLKFDRLQRQLEANKAGASYTAASSGAASSGSSAAAVAVTTSSSSAALIAAAQTSSGTGSSSSSGVVADGASVSVDVSV